MRRYRKKNQSFFLLLIVLMLGIGVGYALLTSTLNIIGSTTLANSTWDIHFDNLQVTDGSVSLEEGDSAATIDQNNNTLVNYAVTLSLPGDFYEFTVDVVNSGTIDGMVSVVTSKLNDVVIDTEHPVPDYLTYSVKYEDGVEIEESHLLAADETETYKIRVEFNSEITGDNLPGDTQTLNFNFGVTYVQADDTAVERENHSLYHVLQNAVKVGTYARKYTRAHQDSYAGTGAKDIYHWYATNVPNGTAIQDKNNVIFAGQCWQMIRTTDTGGVKMIYNGEAENNQCLNTRGNHIGYGGYRTTQNLVSNYYYGTSYEYDSTNNVFSLSGTLTQETWNETTGPTLVGKYTCKQTTESGTCATLYLVESYYNTSSGYVIPLNSNSHYSQFGTLQYNANYDCPSYVGYMYNAVYPHQREINTENMLSTSSLSTSYWYAHNVVWGSPTANRYNLDNPYQVSTTSDYSNLVGEYTFGSSTQTYTGTSVYYIAGVYNTTMYYIQLNNSGNHTLEDLNPTYTYGDSYTDNGNGTYTINNPTTIQRKDWYTEYSNVGTGKYLCKNATNNTCSELWYTTYTRDILMTYIKVADVYKYAKGFTWDGSKYVLNNVASVNFWNFSDSTNQTSLNNAHYTCLNETGECTSISYIYYLGSNALSYINLTNGESIEDAKNKMLYVNTKNSIIKTGIDAWYVRYLSNYDSYIEDTIFCNDRSQINAVRNGWNPNGGVLNGRDSSYLQFKEYNATNYLSCTNETDQFSTLNPKAQLTYKVGLMSSPEMNLLNNDKARVTGQIYWLASPHSFNSYTAVVCYVYSTGGIYNFDVDAPYGVRPAISLKPGTIYTLGDGSMASPYIVE